MKYKIVVALLVATSLMLMTTTVAAGGFDDWGYNYQANIYNGLYGNYARPNPPITEDDTWLQMKWNDAWLNEDGIRHEGYPSYIDSGAWLTNHMVGTYEVNGQTYLWTYFVKIVAVQTGDVNIGGFWYRDGVEIGESIWGSFAVIQVVENDPYADIHGLAYNPPAPTGFGVY